MVRRGLVGHQVALPALAGSIASIIAFPKFHAQVYPIDSHVLTIIFSTAYLLMSDLQSIQVGIGSEGWNSALI